MTDDDNGDQQPELNRKIIEGFREEIERQNSALSKVQSVNAQLRSRLGAAEGEIERLKSENQQLRGHCEALEVQVLVLTEEKEKMAEQLVRWKRDVKVAAAASGAVLAIIGVTVAATIAVLQVMGYIG